VEPPRTRSPIVTAALNSRALRFICFMLFPSVSIRQGEVTWRFTWVRRGIFSFMNSSFGPWGALSRSRCFIFRLSAWNLWFMDFRVAPNWGENPLGLQMSPTSSSCFRDIAIRAKLGSQRKAFLHLHTFHAEQPSRTLPSPLPPHSALYPFSPTFHFSSI